MHLRVRITPRALLIATVVAGFAASGGSALADPSANGLANRANGAPAAADYGTPPGQSSDKSNNGQSDDHKPAGAGGGRKVG
jgi:hypothetical protein